MLMTLYLPSEGLGWTQQITTFIKIVFAERRRWCSQCKTCPRLRAFSPLNKNKCYTRLKSPIHLRDILYSLYSLQYTKNKMESIFGQRVNGKNGFGGWNVQASFISHISTDICKKRKLFRLIFNVLLVDYFCTTPNVCINSKFSLPFLLIIHALNI